MGSDVDTVVNNAKELPCGCRVGFRLCPEGVRLWRRGNDAYDEGLNSGHFGDYIAARQAYYQHVKMTWEFEGYWLEREEVT